MPSHRPLQAQISPAWPACVRDCIRHVAPRPHCQAARLRVTAQTSSGRTSDNGAGNQSNTVQGLRQALQALPAIIDAVLPGDTPARTELDALTRELQQRATSARVDCNQLYGGWKLVYASSGTVVTRTAAAQALAALSALPGVGLSDITQTLTSDGQGGVQVLNDAVFGLGPLGTWRFGIQGEWQPWEQGAFEHVQVVFTSYSLQLTGLLGIRFPIRPPKVTLPVPKNSAQWFTPAIVEEFRLGKGLSGNLFLFQKVS